MGPGTVRVFRLRRQLREIITSVSTHARLKFGRGLFATFQGSVHRFAVNTTTGAKQPFCIFAGSKSAAIHSLGCSITDNAADAAQPMQPTRMRSLRNTEEEEVFIEKGRWARRTT